MGRKKYDTKGKQRRKVTREEDATWRLTHLLTAAHLMSHNVPSLSRFFMRTSSQIGLRINMTMDSMTVKRHVCKKCHTLLLPNGPTPCRVRVSKRGGTHVVVTCGFCGYFRRYPARAWHPAEDSENIDVDNERNESIKQSVTEQNKQDEKILKQDIKPKSDSESGVHNRETSSLPNDENDEDGNKHGQQRSLSGIADRCGIQ